MVGNYQHKNTAQSLAYLLDALEDYDRAESLTELNDIKGAIFHFQQCVEKLIKSSICINGILSVKEHREVTQVLSGLINSENGKYQNNFNKILPNVSKIMWYYIPTRYSVTVNGDVLLRNFTKKEAEQIHKTSTDFLELVFEYVKDKAKIKEKIPNEKEELLKYIKTNFKDVVKIK